MDFVSWNVPVTAANRRSVELLELRYQRSALHLTLGEEDSGRVWIATFKTLQAFESVTWECGAHVLSEAPDGAFFEVLNSPRIDALGGARRDFLKQSHHYVVSTYDEILNVVAWSCDFTLAAPKSEQ